jgi:hypothetical protein
VSDDPKDRGTRVSGNGPGDQNEFESAMLSVISHRQRDRTPLSLTDEMLIDDWMAGRLSAADADRAAGLAKHNLFAAERILEHRLIAAANAGPAIPDAVSSRIFRAARPERTRKSGIVNWRWPTFSGWQWSGMSAAAATIAFVAMIGYGQWDQNRPSIASREGAQIALRQDGPMALRQDETVSGEPRAPQTASSFQIAMVSLEEGRGRRMRGSKPSETDSDKSSIQMLVGVLAHDLEVPAELLRRTIDSVMANKSETEHSELMEYLRAKDDKLDSHSQILIDTALAERVPKDITGSASIQIRAYDLTDPLAADIRKKIKIPQTATHSILMTLGR